MRTALRTVRGRRNACSGAVSRVSGIGKHAAKDSPLSEFRPFFCGHHASKINPIMELGIWEEKAHGTTVRTTTDREDTEDRTVIVVIRYLSLVSLRVSVRLADWDLNWDPAI